MISPESFTQYALFGGLLPDEIARIQPFLSESAYQANQDIIVEGTPCDRIYFILEGTVDVIKDDTVIFEFKAGAVVGEMEVIDIMPSAATVRAHSDCKVMTLSSRALHDIYHMDMRIFSTLIMNLARDISRRERTLTKLAAKAIREGGLLKP